MEQTPPAPPFTSPNTAPTPPTRTKTRRSASIGAHALGLLQVTHPLPSAMYVLAVALFSLLAAAQARHAPDPFILTRALVGVACAQIAIGSLNDYCDRERDARTQPNKPLARGVIAPWEALALVGGASVTLVALMATLGPIPFALGLLIEGVGLAYDLWFKGTLVSGFLYAIYFPLIPLLAWALFGSWRPFIPWLFPIGAALGIAMNIANSLPDLEGDLANGVRGLPHALGLRRGLLVTWLTPLAVVALLGLLDVTGLVPAHPLTLIAAMIAGALAPLLAALLYLRRPQPATLRLTFYIQALGIVALIGAWLAAVAL